MGDVLSDIDDFVHNVSSKTDPLSPLKPKPKAAPAAPAPPVMPIMDDEAAQKARRRSLLRQTGRRGRSSTILSQGLGVEPEPLG